MTKSTKVQMHEGTRSTCVYIPRYINVRYDFAGIFLGLRDAGLAP